MAILDWVKELPLAAIYKERLVDSEKQIYSLEQKIIDLSGKVVTLEQEKVELQVQLDQSEQDRRALEEQVKEKLAESHVVTPTFDPESGTWVDSESNLRYCAKCKASGSLSPMTNCEHGWKCPACNAYAADPKRPEPPFRMPTRTRSLPY